MGHRVAPRRTAAAVGGSGGLQQTVERQIALSEIQPAVYSTCPNWRARLTTFPGHFNHPIPSLGGPFG